ncbi:methylamine utilization protein [Catenovulum sp. SM1970]|uniref:cytochrome-c peroxidase n=1 Tax=Marinifaba aquimaris TaxID=2741323 RepID=UPI00157409B1|nr:cytochrome c peroxidase [Marinifaba aquimaris]NTS75926.1 methylamine utilization protein [Marinifaba aquimaris]
MTLFIASELVSKPEHKWSQTEEAMLATLALSDEYQQVPEKSPLITFGQALFFDKGLSINGQVACASCHQPALFFTDGEPLATNGLLPTPRHTPSVALLNDADFLFWDGRKDSLWAQALEPLESLLEHGASRTFYLHYIKRNYPETYQAVFADEVSLAIADELPAQASPVAYQDWQTNWQQMTDRQQQAVNQVFSNLGKALAAYQNSIKLKPSKFDLYVHSLKGDSDTKILDEHEINGLKLFISEKTQCTHCHNGAALTNHTFQATAVPKSNNDLGRINAINQLDNDIFNCYGQFSNKDNCFHLDYLKREGIDLIKAFKVPTLRNIAKTTPYMHKGQFAQLNQVLDYYNKANRPIQEHSEIVPLGLYPYQLKQLEAFLLTLSSDYANDDSWFTPLDLP